jgi:hypothetical protein
MNNSAKCEGVHVKICMSRLQEATCHNVAACTLCPNFLKLPHISQSPGSTDICKLYKHSGKVVHQSGVHIFHTCALCNFTYSNGLCANFLHIQIYCMHAHTTKKPSTLLTSHAQPKNYFSLHVIKYSQHWKKFQINIVDVNDPPIMPLFYALWANHTWYQVCSFPFLVMFKFFTFSKAVQEFPHALFFVLKHNDTSQMYRNKHFLITCCFVQIWNQVTVLFKMKQHLGKSKIRIENVSFTLTWTEDTL